MSSVTDVMFCTNFLGESQKFCDLVQKYENFTPIPCEPSGKCTSLFVYHVGFNYINIELLECLKHNRWGKETLIYINGEEDFDPTIKVFQ